jgi:hypothetical protein
LVSGIAAIADDAKAAQAAFDSGNDAGTAQPVSPPSALCASSLPAWGSTIWRATESDFRLGIKERDYQSAVLAAQGLSFDAVADDGLVIAGQPVKLSILVVNHGPSDVSVTGASVAGFDAPAPCTPGVVKNGAVYTCSSDARVPQNALRPRHTSTTTTGRHPENQPIQILAPDVGFGAPFAAFTALVALGACWPPAKITNHRPATPVLGAVPIATGRRCRDRRLRYRRREIGSLCILQPQ